MMMNMMQVDYEISPSPLVSEGGPNKRTRDLLSHFSRWKTFALHGITIKTKEKEFKSVRGKNQLFNQ